MKDEVHDVEDMKALAWFIESLKSEHPNIVDWGVGLVKDVLRSSVQRSPQMLAPLVYDERFEKSVEMLTGAQQ